MLLVIFSFVTDIVSVSTTLFHFFFLKHVNCIPYAVLGEAYQSTLLG